MLVDLSSITTDDLAWLLLGRLEQEAESMTCVVEKLMATACRINALR